MIKKEVGTIYSYFGDVFVRFWGSDAGIMTEETGENSPKDEDDTTNMDISKCAKLFFYRYLTAAPNKTL